MGDAADPVVWLDQVRLGREADVGGKCAALGELRALGLNVPDGFAVTTRACAALHDRGAPSAALRAAIVDAYRALAARVGDRAPSVAVRSSAVGEDRAGASFAGQLETCLGVRGEDEVVEALRRCVASASTARVQGYRAAMGLDHAATAIGVAVQQMVPASAAGVLFTQDAVSGDPSVMSLESTIGLGEPVAAGEVTPDRFLVSKLSGAIVRRAISAKALALCLDASGRCVRTPVPADQQGRASLDDGEIARLVEVGQRIEQHHGRAMDIEWAIARGARGDAPFILQARPVTVAPRRAPGARGVMEGIVGTLCRGRSTSRSTPRRDS